MTQFIQLHYLTTYPPSNPNRDDQGQPKTAVYGGVPRLRISSQSLKRAVRFSDVMRTSLEGNLGDRTRKVGDLIIEHLKQLGSDNDQAFKIAEKVSEVFGKIDEKAKKDEKKGKKIRIRQLAFISPEEKKVCFEMAKKIYQGDEEINNLDSKILRKADGAIDIAMFGRMLADQPEYNRDSSVQVSHAITTHKAIVEDDYFTAADDLKLPSEGDDMGAGFVGESGFGSGVFYLYACINYDLLVSNLDGDKELASKAISALIEALAVSTPSGKRNSYSHHTLASYIRAEIGKAQPRSLTSAFLHPVKGENLMLHSITKLEEQSEKFDKCYGKLVDSYQTMDVEKGTGSIKEIKSFVTKQLKNG